MGAEYCAGETAAADHWCSDIYICMPDMLLDDISAPCAVHAATAAFVAIACQY